MHVVYLIGRIALVAIFLVSGVQKLLDLAAVATQISAKLTIPDFLAPYTANVESITGMTTPQMLAIAAAVVEIVFSLFVVLNLAPRFSALFLLAYSAVVTFYSYDLWSVSGPAFSDALFEVLKSVSLMGGLLMLFAVGPWQAVEYEDDAA